MRKITFKTYPAIRPHIWNISYEKAGKSGIIWSNSIKEPVGKLSTNTLESWHHLWNMHHIYDFPVLVHGINPTETHAFMHYPKILKYAHSSIIYNSLKLRSQTSTNTNCLINWNIQTMEHNKMNYYLEELKTIWISFTKILSQLR